MYWISNVKMETGYDFSEKNNVKTKTELVTLGMEDGIIKAIERGTLKQHEAEMDGEGYLILPSFADNHIHLDKGHYGGPWQAVVPLRGVQERIKEEEGFLISFLEHTPERAQALIDLIAGKGATFLRVQVNIDPIVGLKNLECIYEVLKNNAHGLDYEIVAFPQHGTLITEEKGWLSEAMKHPGIDAIGGVDPATIDGDIELSLKTTFNLAKKYQKKVDIHLHDSGTLGLFEINRIIDYTMDYQMEGKVQISHAFGLGNLTESQLAKVSKRLHDADIAINTTVPLSSYAPNIPLLQAHGVRVHVINDCINDHWSPFGTGDMLQRVNRAAEKFSQVDERSLARCLALITRGITPLSHEGELLWPKIGDKANFVLVNAESSAHAVARVPQERIVFFQGKMLTFK